MDASAIVVFGGLLALVRATNAHRGRGLPERTPADVQRGFVPGAGG